MAIEKELYLQVVMIHRKDLDNNKKGKINKYNFQGQFLRSIRWFDLVHECLEEKFITREPDLYTKLH